MSQSEGSPSRAVFTLRHRDPPGAAEKWIKIPQNLETREEPHILNLNTASGTFDKGGGVVTFIQVCNLLMLSSLYGPVSGGCTHRSYRGLMKSTRRITELSVFMCVNESQCF